jgi:DNA-binding NarL/FixJ family response regulator
VNRTRILIADDHTILRQALIKILNERRDLEVVGEAGDGLELLALVKRLNPDLIILDISMPNLRGIEAVREIKTLSPKAKIVILTMHKNSEYVQQAIAAGCDGYVLKEDADTELFAAIARAQAQKIYISPKLSEALMDDWVRIQRGDSLPVAESGRLTTREREVLKMIAEGHTNKEIAKALFLSVRTVDHHRANIMTKLNLKKTADLVKYAIDKGYI